jgi:hypothetical protein
VNQFVSILLMMVALARAAAGATFSESFATEPVAWEAWNADAFRWDASAQNLAVTWDSRATNSFFYYRLPFELTRRDSFAVEFTLRLDDLAVGIDPNKPSTFEVGLGFMNVAEAKRPNYFRGSGVNPVNGARSLVEFSYFPASGPIDATVAPVMVSTNNQFAYSHSFPVELAMGETYRVRMAFDAATQVLATSILHNGAPYGEPPDNTIRSLTYPAAFGDFRVDAFSINSYSDAGQSPPQFAGSLLAHGIVDDVVITWPDPPIGKLSGGFVGGVWGVKFSGRSGWRYLLERTTNFVGWQEVASALGIDGEIELKDETGIGERAFYRVRAER